MATQEVERPPVRATRFREARSAASRRPPRWYFEVLIVGIFYAAYELSRAATPERPVSAINHAHGLIHLEQILHLNIERPLNTLLVHAPWLAVGSGYYYATLNYVVTPAVLFWLLWRRPKIYRSARTVLLLASFAALIVYVLYPVAPPRLALPGMTDIVVVHNILDAGDAAKSGGFLNIYAAMPSLHVGWAMWVALSLDRANAPHRWRHVFWLYPIATTFVVIGTANHYLLDAIAGAALVSLSWAIVRSYLAVSDRRQPARRCTGSENCELCDFSGPRRYLVTFRAMLEANGLHMDPNHPALAGDDLDAPVEAVIPIATGDASSDHALDDVLAEFADWGNGLARIATHESTA